MQLGAERINWSMAKRRQNIYRSSQPQNTRRSWRKDTKREQKKYLRNVTQISSQRRPSELADLLNAIQQVSEDVNLLKKKLELK